MAPRSGILWRRRNLHWPFILHPPAGGSVFRCVEFEPEDPAVIATLDGRTAFAEMGAADNIVDGARHPFMHWTDSVDYAIILTGEIYMLLDEEDVLLKAGDVVIQRAQTMLGQTVALKPVLLRLFWWTGLLAVMPPNPSKKAYRVNRPD